jgi:hypothetical protein
MAYSVAQYLEKIATIITNTDILLTTKPNEGSYVQLGVEPIQVNISDGDMYHSKTFDKKLDMNKMAHDLGYNKEEFKLFMQRMMTYHECGHVKFTPDKTTYPERNDTMLYCGNFVEDARVESRLSVLYPPAEFRIELMNRILLSNINIADMKVEPGDRLAMAKLSGVLAGYYFYGLTKVEPKSALVKKMIEVEQLMWNNPKITSKQMVENAKAIYDLIPGIEPETLEQDISGMMFGVSDGLEGDLEQVKNAISRHDSESISREMKDIKRVIKAYGLDIGEPDERNMAFEKYVDHKIINRINQQLCRILGAKPSKHDMMDFDGHSLDVESYLEYENNRHDETKMYLNAGKKIKPDFHISVCIDHSGSMGGTKMELAKKSAINFCLACDKVGIKTEIIQFDGGAEMVKYYDQDIRSTEIQNIDACGGTVISNAVKISMEHFIEMKNPDTQKAIILITDGCDGSAVETASYMSRDRNIKAYMIGIEADMNMFVSQMAENGTKLVSFKNLQDMKKMGDVMAIFSTDFVRRNNLG